MNPADAAFSASMHDSHPGKKGVLPIREAYEFMLFHQFIKGVTLCRTQVKEIGVWSLYD
jgi:hypothetical protein